MSVSKTTDGASQIREMVQAADPSDLRCFVRAVLEALWLRDGAIDPDKPWNSDTFDDIVFAATSYRLRADSIESGEE